MEDIILHTLGNIGVPAALCFYTLFEVKKSVERLTDAFDRWSNLIDTRLKDLEKDVQELKQRRANPC